MYLVFVGRSGLAVKEGATSKIKSAASAVYIAKY